MMESTIEDRATCKVRRYSKVGEPTIDIAGIKVPEGTSYISRSSEGKIVERSEKIRAVDAALKNAIVGMNESFKTNNLERVATEMLKWINISYFEIAKNEDDHFFLILIKLVDTVANNMDRIDALESKLKVDNKFDSAESLKLALRSMSEIKRIKSKDNNIGEEELEKLVRFTGVAALLCNIDRIYGTDPKKHNFRGHALINKVFDKENFEEDISARRTLIQIFGRNAPETILDIIRTHHENASGTGPCGADPSEISEVAQIISANTKASGDII